MSMQNPVISPGLTNIPESARKACDMPTLDQRSPAFARMFKPADEGVRHVLRMAEGEVIIIPSTGSGGWEAAVTNTLSPGDTVLAARFGMFSHRWINLCHRHGLNVQIIETPWDQGAPLAAIEAALRADRAGTIRRYWPGTTRRRPVRSPTSAASASRWMRRGMGPFCSWTGCPQLPRCRSTLPALALAAE